MQRDRSLPLPAGKYPVTTPAPAEIPSAEIPRLSPADGRSTQCGSLAACRAMATHLVLLTKAITVGSRGRNAPRKTPGRESNAWPGAFRTRPTTMDFRRTKPRPADTDRTLISSRRRRAAPVVAERMLGGLIGGGGLPVERDVQFGADGHRFSFKCDCNLQSL